MVISSFSDASKDGPQYVWWKDAHSTLKVNNQSTSKVRDGSEFSSAFGALEFSSGKHEVDYAISRQGDGYIYVGFAVPGLATDVTFCSRDMVGKVWYYFGCGHTNALRSGYDDVVSKEIGGPEMKVPKLNQGDKVRAFLDMDARELRFSILKLDEGGWKEMPGKISGLPGTVVAAVCIQDRGDGVSLSDSAKALSKQEEDKAVKKKVDKYAHVQSKLATQGSLRAVVASAKDAGGGGEDEGGRREAMQKEREMGMQRRQERDRQRMAMSQQAQYRTTDGDGGRGASGSMVMYHPQDRASVISLITGSDSARRPDAAWASSSSSPKSQSHEVRGRLGGRGEGTVMRSTAMESASDKAVGRRGHSSEGNLHDSGGGVQSHRSNSAGGTPVIEGSADQHGSPRAIGRRASGASSIRASRQLRMPNITVSGVVPPMHTSLVAGRQAVGRGGMIRGGSSDMQAAGNNVVHRFRDKITVAPGGDEAHNLSQSGPASFAQPKDSVRIAGEFGGVGKRFPVRGGTVIVYPVDNGTNKHVVARGAILGRLGGRHRHHHHQQQLPQQAAQFGMVAGAGGRSGKMGNQPPVVTLAG